MSKVLVVESDKQVFHSICKMLETAEIQVLSAISYSKAVNIVEEDHSIDLIVCSSMLSDRSGIDFLQYIKKSPNCQIIPFIITCQQCPETTVKAMIELGVSDIIQDITDAENFIHRVKKAMDERPTILVVDDEEIIRTLLKTTLSLNRFRVVLAGSGDEALEKLKETKITAIVSDIMMPGMDGFQLMVKVKETYPEMPYIIITGYSGKYTPEYALKNGADGFFKKPFKNLELIMTLRQVLQKSKKKLLIS